MKKKKKEGKDDAKTLKFQNMLLRIDLNKAKRVRDESIRQKNDWKAIAQKLAAFAQQQEHVPRDISRIVKNFPKR
jgi:hypothetical protein